MAQINTALGNVVYVDANIVIYAVEGFPLYRSFLEALFANVDDRKLQIVTSELTLAEVLVKPIADRNPAIREAYQNILTPSDQFRVVPIDRNILEEAASIRAVTGVKLPDAIHLATAKQSACSSFLSNDQLIRSGIDIPILRIHDLIS